MDYGIPTGTQRDFLEKLMRAAEPGLATALQSQCDGALIAAEEHCTVCFQLKIANRNVRVPRNLGNPLSYDAVLSGKEREAVQVLLWHEGGYVESVEISWVGDEHPKLEDIDLESR